MCAVFEHQGNTYRPGKTVKVIEERFRDTPPIIWIGFARSEILKWWLRKKGGEAASLAADKFAERNHKTGQLVWQDMPAGKAIRAVIEPGNPGKKYLPLRVVTRPATADEIEQFGHDRMPVIVGI